MKLEELQAYQSARALPDDFIALVVPGNNNIKSIGPTTY